MMNGPTEGITDISFKEDVFREATATGFLRLSQKSLLVVSDGRSVKGDVREASNIAAVLAVKETPRTIPHCHPIPIEACSVRWDIEESGLRCTVTVRTHWSTGVEMEALCGVSAAPLCL